VTPLTPNTLHWVTTGYDAEWHLSWDGRVTVCGALIIARWPDRPLTLTLDVGPPTDRPLHRKCQTLVANSNGFWEGGS
jgi:hypothetical protein